MSTNPRITSPEASDSPASVLDMLGKMVDEALIEFDLTFRGLSPETFSGPPEAANLPADNWQIDAAARLKELDQQALIDATATGQLALINSLESTTYRAPTDELTAGTDSPPKAPSPDVHRVQTLYQSDQARQPSEQDVDTAGFISMDLHPQPAQAGEEAAVMLDLAGARDRVKAALAAKDTTIDSKTQRVLDETGLFLT